MVGNYVCVDARHIAINPYIDKLGTFVVTKDPLSELNTGDPLFYIKVHMDGVKEARFHVNFIDLLDRVFVHDGLKFLSIEQERFITKFFEEAGIVTDKLKNGNENPYIDLDEVFVYLDDFLGSYVGEDNGRYARC